MKDYTNNNQQNLIAVIHYLAKDYLKPRSVQNVIDGTGLSRDTVFRTLWNLEKAGWEREESGVYTIACEFTKLADAARDALIQLFREHLG